MTLTAPVAPRHDWSLEEIETLFTLPFNDWPVPAKQGPPQGPLPMLRRPSTTMPCKPVKAHLDD